MSSVATAGAALSGLQSIHSSAAIRARFSEAVTTTRAPQLRGARALRWYAKFFFDPIGCISDAYDQYGKFVVAGNITRLQGRERLHVLALGPDANRQVLGNTDVFHTTAQGWPGR